MEEVNNTLKKERERGEREIERERNSVRVKREKECRGRVEKESKRTS